MDAEGDENRNRQNRDGKCQRNDPAPPQGQSDGSCDISEPGQEIEPDNKRYVVSGGCAPGAIDEQYLAPGFEGQEAKYRCESCKGDGPTWPYSLVIHFLRGLLIRNEINISLF